MTHNFALISTVVLALTTPHCVYANVTLMCVVSGEVAYKDSKGTTTEQLPAENVVVMIDDKKANTSVKFKSTADYSFFMDGFLKAATIKNMSDDHYFKWTYFENTKVSKTTGSIEIDRSSWKISVNDSWMHSKENMTTNTRFFGHCKR